MICDKSGLLCMEMSIEDLWGLSDQALIRAYVDARRRYAEGKLARDTQRARLEWMRAKAFVNGTGNVTERRMAVDVSEELARKGQEVREATRDVDLLKIGVDVNEIVIRLRGLHGAATAQVEDPTDKPAHQEPE